MALTSTPMADGLWDAGQDFNNVGTDIARELADELWTEVKTRLAECDEDYDGGKERWLSDARSRFLQDRETASDLDAETYATAYVLHYSRLIADFVRHELIKRLETL